MIFNSKIPKNVDIDGVTFVIRQLTASEQANLTDELAKIDSHASMVKCAHIALDCALVDIVGLKNADDGYIKPVRGMDGKLPFEFTDGFSIVDLRKIIDAILKAGQLADDLKKN